MTHFVLISVIIISLFSNIAQARFIDRKAEGWHFYESLQKKQQKTKAPPKEEAAKNSKPKTEDPLEALNKYKKNLQWLKARAIMDPTKANVADYMFAQKELMGRASIFAKKWLEVVYTTPKLDYTIKHPTSQMARHVYLDQKRLQVEKEISTLSQSHGLFFFFSGSCAYCKHFAPIVKEFSRKYGWDVIAISTDGSTLPEFPKSVVDNGISQRLGVSVLPTLLAVNPKAEEIIPLSHGMSSQDQIIDRVRVLIIERRHP